MKKVKIMLTAITVFAVVGGALAFKAKGFNTFTYYTLDAAGTTCNVPFEATTTNITPINLRATLTATDKAHCPFINLTTKEGN